MNIAPQTTPPAPAAGRTGILSRRWVPGATMIIGFALVMIVSNSIASALENPVAALLIGALLAVLVLWVYRLAVLRIERRPAVELAPANAKRMIVLGFAGGLLLSAATVGILALFGGYRITGWGSLSGALTVIGMMCAIAVAEEVLFRGVIFGLVQKRAGTWLALAVSAALFGLVHLVNPGATVWGAVAIAIEAGLMLGAAYVATGSLWLPIGLHLGWNIATVAVFGTVTSGSESRGAIVTATTSGPDWLTGGSFGPEASVIAVVVCSAATAILLAIARRRGRIVGRA
ncbi:lysostaphin resistance A-like protein [Microbacterium sp. AGC85]